MVLGCFFGGSIAEMGNKINAMRQLFIFKGKR